MGVILSLLLDYNSVAIRDPALKCVQWYWRLLFTVLGMGFTAGIAYSRLFLGVHSLNQVFYGLLLGTWFAISCHFIARDKLLKLVQDLLEVKESRLREFFLITTGSLCAAYIV